LKFQVDGVQPEDLETIDGLRVISQEGKKVVVLFASEEGLREFRRRLSLVARGERVTRQDVLFAIKRTEAWSPEDRKGPALRNEGIPDSEAFVVDVELWPLEYRPDREAMLANFERWCDQGKVTVIDAVKYGPAILYRVRVRQDAFQVLLNHRDVRLVDLPPRYQLDVSVVHLPLEQIAEVPPPSEEVPGIVILDSGLTTGHPLLGPAVGDAQSFISGVSADDECDHGTRVAGLALYGDIWECARARQFIPQFRLFSGRVLDSKGEFEHGFVENHIREAVRYFVEYYGCRVFNVSFGDERKPFTGGHVRGLAAVLDTLAREYNVLFTVSAGNFTGTDRFPADWRNQYPGYLCTDKARIIDPAPALNVLTVGSLARGDVSPQAQRFPRDPAYQPIARRDQPSPFSRTGPGPGGAIKPDVVEYGGNYWIDERTGQVRATGLGELTTRQQFQENLFIVDSGTSYAAPKVAHLAALLLKEYPDASPDLLRALIVAHSHHPQATVTLVSGDEDTLYRLTGYGKPDWTAARYSSENRVTLFAQETIGENQHQFYEIPLPDDFFAPPPRRPRRITVALAHTPVVRRTRVEYKASRINFRVVRALSIDDVARVFRHTTKSEREPSMAEIGNFRPGPTRRDKGTVQKASWEIQQIRNQDWDGNHLFVVVTRSVPGWAEGLVERERYALVVIIEDRSAQQVRYYTQIQQRLQIRLHV